MPSTIAPYGTWTSPITSAAIVAGTIGLGAPIVDGESSAGAVYWSESRPSEGGRAVIVRRSAAGAIADVLPAPWNARTRVHEYGGGAWTVAADVLYFSHFVDGRIYALALTNSPDPADPADLAESVDPADSTRAAETQTPSQTPQALTPEGAWRYADFRIDRPRNRLICVCEDHTGEVVLNRLVAVPLTGAAANDPKAIQVLADRADFFASPALSPDGRSLAWLTWDNPNLPWDGTTLWQATIAAEGQLSEPQAIAGGPDESVFQPLWSPTNVLYFVSDRSGWWNLYRSIAGKVEALYPLAAEFGLPQWVFGMATYDFLSATEIICTYTQNGLWTLARLSLEPAAEGTAEGAADPAATLTPIDLAYTLIANPIAVAGQVLCLAGSAIAATAIVQIEPTTGQTTILKQSSDLTIDPAYLAEPTAIEFPTSNGQTAYGLLYLPKNPNFQAPETERPPLKVKIHGGPTAQTSSSLNLALQYWTSRGFAVLDVNYRGSTGYGRAYRSQLDGQWGVVDVADCAYGAKYLVDRGLVDGDRLTIAGGSAGGYTTLAALAGTNVFRAGASHYGVSDLEALARDTHKFEARYLDRLIGPYPDRQDLYIERSPLSQVDQLNCPVIFFQGLDDRVVPPNQAEVMVAALRAKGIPVAYVPFAGEQHGFRQAANIRRALDGEFWFYAQVFGFTPAEAIEPLEIFNLASAEGEI